MTHTFNIPFSDILETAPYQESLLLLLSDGTLHSGKRTSVPWVRYPGSKTKEQRGESDVWVPIGVNATYSAEVYFEQDVVGWAKETKQQTLTNKDSTSAENQLE